MISNMFNQNKEKLKIKIRWDIYTHKVRKRKAR